jgi:hypothetical protein
MKRRFTIVVIASLLMACSRPNKNVDALDLTIDVVPIDSDVFRISIYIPTLVRSRLLPKTIENIIYRPDSSIYHQRGSKVIYPLYIEAVANGNKQVIEYLVSFDKLQVEGPLKLFYKDKYINYKTYPLKIK